jgi:hypothetical protein
LRFETLFVHVNKVNFQGPAEIISEKTPHEELLRFKNNLSGIFYMWYAMAHGRIEK